MANAMQMGMGLRDNPNGALFEHDLRRMERNAHAARFVPIPLPVNQAMRIQNAPRLTWCDWITTALRVNFNALSGGLTNYFRR